MVLSIQAAAENNVAREFATGSAASLPPDPFQNVLKRQGDQVAEVAIRGTGKGLLEPLSRSHTFFPCTEYRRRFRTSFDSKKE